MFSYIFLVISCLLIVKPVRNALFLEYFTAADLPYAFILVAFAAALITFFYGRYANRARLDLLINISMAFIILNLAVFRLLLYIDYQAGWFIYAFYIWVAIFGVITTSQFWILANYIFNAREARRLFGFIGAGAISGGIFGGYLTNFLAPIIGTDNLLLICIVFLVICMLILRSVWKMRSIDQETESQRQQRQMRDQESQVNAFKLLMTSRHMAYLAGIVAIGVIVANLVDYQYNIIIEKSIADKDARTAFFGFWLSTLSIVSLVIQLFFTGRILNSFGVSTSLFFLPLGILAGAIAILIYPVLWAAIIIKVSEGSFKQSINKAGLELLVLPIPSAIKTQVKSFIDIFVDSFATGVGGIIILAASAFFKLTVGQFSLVLIPLISLWLFLIVKIRREYIQAFRLAIEKRTIDLSDQSVNLQDASLFEGLLTILKSDNERQISYVLSLLENVRNNRFIPYLNQLLDHPSKDIRLQVIEILGQYHASDMSGKIRPMLTDDAQEVRVAAINYLVDRSDEADQHQVISHYLNSTDPRTQGAAMVSAAEAIAKIPRLRNSLNLSAFISARIQALEEAAGNGAQNEAMLVFIAQAIGLAKMQDLYPALAQLLDHRSDKIRKAAIISAGQSGDTVFIPLLMGLLQDRRLRKFARQSLAAFGEEIVPGLAMHLNDDNTDLIIRLNLPKVLGYIGSQPSIDLLTEQLNQNNLLIRYQVLKALSRLRKNFPMLRFNIQKIESQIFEEARNYLQMIAVIQVQDYGNGNPDRSDKSRPLHQAHTARQLLIRVLREKLDKNLERIFRLLGLKYIQKDIFNAYLGVVSNNQDLQANAVEFLDNILDNHLKRSIIPIIETSSFDTLLELGRSHFNIAVPDESECFEAILSGIDNWLKACTIYLITVRQDRRFDEQILELSTSKDFLIRETVAYAIAQLGIEGS